MPRKRRAACSSPAMPSSCATGPMPGRWPMPPTARSRARSAWPCCRRATARARGTRRRSAGSSSRCRNTRPIPKEAADLVRYLTERGRAEAARARGLVQSDAQEPLRRRRSCSQANPFLKDFQPVLESAVARPSTVTGRQLQSGLQRVRARRPRHAVGPGHGRGEPGRAGEEPRPGEPRRTLVIRHGRE